MDPNYLPAPESEHLAANTAESIATRTFQTSLTTALVTGFPLAHLTASDTPSHDRRLVRLLVGRLTLAWTLNRMSRDYLCSIHELHISRIDWPAPVRCSACRSLARQATGRSHVSGDLNRLAPVPAYLGSAPMSRN